MMKCVSLATDSCGWLSNIRCSSVVPDLGQPTTKTNGFLLYVVAFCTDPTLSGTGQPGITAFGRNQIFVGTAFGYRTVLNVENHVRSNCVAQFVRYEKSCLSFAKPDQGIHDGPAAVPVQTCGRFVQDQNGRFAKGGPCYRNSLPLSDGQRDSPLTDPGLVTVREGFNKVMGVGKPRRINNLIFAAAGYAKSNVFPNTGSEDEIIDAGRPVLSQFAAAVRRTA